MCLCEPIFCLVADTSGVTRDVKLLSFGADEGGEEEEPVTFKKKPIVRPDCELLYQRYLK